MLGFGSLGEFALGETPTQVAAPAATPSVFSANAQPFKRGLAVAVIATTFVGFIAPPQPAKANTFTQFSQPLKRVNKTLHVAWLNTPAQIARTVAPFTSFSQPIKSRYTIFDKSQSVFYAPEEPPAPPFTGFSRFEGVIKAGLNIAPFSNFNFVPFVAPIDTHDGVFVKRKRKRYGPDPLDLELEERAKRRAAVELAVYGPKPEILPDIPAETGIIHTSILNVDELARIVFAAQQAQKASIRAGEDAAEEDEIDLILREIF